MLVGLSRWHDDRVDVDANIVLGTLLADGQRKAIRFDVEGRSSVTVEVSQSSYGGGAAKTVAYDIQGSQLAVY